MAENGFLRSLPAWSLLAIAIVPPVLAVTLSLRLNLDFGLGTAGQYVVMGVVAVWAMVFAGFWWKRLDEASHEAQKWAAIWGGSFGITAGLIVVMAIAFSAPGASWLAGFAASVVERSEGRIAPTSWTFFLGAVFAATANIAGFLLAWAFWWARRR